MGANRDISKLGPLPTTVGGAFVWTTAGWSQATKANVGLGNADNTADSAKPVSVAQQAALDLKAPIASPQFTGNSIFGGNAQVLAALVTIYGDITLTRTSGNTAFNLSGNPGQQKRVAFYTGTSARWTFGSSNGAESGSNAGSDFWISRFADDSSGIDVPVRIIRATGETQMMSASASGPVRVGQYTLATLPSASAFNGYEIDVTNSTVSPAGPKRCRSNGTNWLILNTNTPVS